MHDSRIIVVDDEDELRHAVAQGLDLAGHKTSAFKSAEPALAALNRNIYGIVVSDIRMSGMDGLELMRRALEVDPALPVILMTGHGDVALAVEAMRAGAYDFIEKPFAVSHLVAVVERALEKRRLVLENRALREQVAQASALEDTIVGRSQATVRLRAQIATLAPTDADVLVLGETGAGKDVVARALHAASPRRAKPYVALNCGALPADMIESELFGHEQGAFTGASRQRIGKLEHADGGTVFLDEIESMPLDLQVKLLRVIETRSVERLGSNKLRQLDLRFIAATKLDLEKESVAGRFRKDLYYRLNVVHIDLPPLRARKDDIPLLFYHLAREARARYRREIPDVSPELIQTLTAHDWPGNVRELRNVADRFVLGVGTGFASEAVAANGQRNLAERMDAFEKSLIEAEIARNDGMLKPSYEQLGISRKTLYDKMKKHGIQRSDFDDD